MNVPNLNFDAERGSARLPSSAANGSRSVAYAPYGEFVNFSAQDEPTSDIRKLLFKYLGLALRYRWLIVVCCGLSLAVGFILTYTQTPIYKATVTVQIEQRVPRVVKIEGAEDPNSGMDSRRFYQTQYELIRSKSLAERVVAELGLAAASDFFHPPTSSAWAKLRSLIRSSPSTGTDDGVNKESLEQRKAVAASMVQRDLSIRLTPD